MQSLSDSVLVSVRDSTWDTVDVYVYDCGWDYATISIYDYVKNSVNKSVEACILNFMYEKFN